MDQENGLVDIQPAAAADGILELKPDGSEVLFDDNKHNAIVAPADRIDDDQIYDDYDRYDRERSINDQSIAHDNNEGAKTSSNHPDTVQHDDPLFGRDVMHKFRGFSNFTNRKVKVLQRRSSPLISGSVERQADAVSSRRQQRQSIVVGSTGFQPANACELLCQEKLTTLEHRMRSLETQLKRQESALQEYEAVLRKTAQGARGCVQNGKHYSDGQSFPGADPCSECICSNSRVYCSLVGCKPLSCPHPERVPGQCCPVCKQQCSYMGSLYEHGQLIRPKPCVVCRCEDGNTMCKYEQASDCPSLNCSPEKQITLANHCCAVCLGDDFCAQNPCHGNATCINLKHGRECRCKHGFFGNGADDCFDVDECKLAIDGDDAMTQRSDRCGAGTRCINLPGSFACECLPGFSRVDDRSCVDLLLF